MPGHTSNEKAKKNGGGKKAGKKDAGKKDMKAPPFGKKKGKKK